MKHRWAGRVLALALTALMLSAQAGCGDGPAVPAETGRDEAEINRTPVTLHVYNMLGERTSMENAEAYIRRTMPNVSVESIYEIGPKLESAQLSAVRGGGGPEILYTQDYYTYVQSGYLQDLTSESYLNNYMISALSDIEVGGRIYALPVGNGYISGLMVNARLLEDLGCAVPDTQEEFVSLCRNLQVRREETGVRAYAYSMLYNDAAALAAMPFLLGAYTDSAYVQWLSKYRSDPASVSFDTPAFTRVLDALEQLKELNLYENGDFNANDTENLQQVLRGEAAMCSVSYVVYAAHFESQIQDVDGVPSVRILHDGVEHYAPAEDYVFLPYMGATEQDRWLATNGDWYLGINANVTDEATLKASRLYLEYIASTQFAPELYSPSAPAGSTTYYRRDDKRQYDYFQDTHPELYQCLMENSIVKNPYQFLGSNVFTFAQRYYLCGQKYYAGLEGARSYLPIDSPGEILAALEAYRATGVSPFEVPDRVVGETHKAYRYVRIYSRSNESALGNLLADALREYTGADLAAVNAGALTAELESGEITESDLATTMLYGLSNHIVTVRCKGENLISILSTNNVASVTRTDKSGVFGGLVIPSGFSYAMTFGEEGAAEYGSRAQISDVRLASGAPLDPEAYYTVATTDYELGGTDGWNAFTLLPQETPAALPEGIVLYRSFDPGDPAGCVPFDLTSDNYEAQYEEILSWAQEQPNIVQAVIRYIEAHSQNGVLEPVTIDGRIRAVNMPRRLDPAVNGVDLG